MRFSSRFSVPKLEGRGSVTSPYRDYVAENEGYRASVYKDTLENDTIGHGFNIGDESIAAFIASQGFDVEALRSGKASLSKEDSERLLGMLYDNAESSVRKHVPNFDTLPAGVKRTLVDMSYNMGESKFNPTKWKNFFNHVNTGNYTKAGKLLENTPYMNQVKSRGKNNMNALIEAQSTKPEVMAPVPKITPKGITTTPVTPTKFSIKPQQGVETKYELGNGPKPGTDIGEGILTGANYVLPAASAFLNHRALKRLEKKGLNNTFKKLETPTGNVRSLYKPRFATKYSNPQGSSLAEREAGLRFADAQESQMEAQYHVQDDQFKQAQREAILQRKNQVDMYNNQGENNVDNMNVGWRRQQAANLAGERNNAIGAISNNLSKQQAYHNQLKAYKALGYVKRYGGKVPLTKFSSGGELPGGDDKKKIVSRYKNSTADDLPTSVSPSSEETMPLPTWSGNKVRLPIDENLKFNNQEEFDAYYRRQAMNALPQDLLAYPGIDDDTRIVLGIENYPVYTAPEREKKVAGPPRTLPSYGGSSTGGFRYKSNKPAKGSVTNRTRTKFSR